MTAPHSAASRPTDALWDRWRRHGDVRARAQLLDRFLGLVYHAAREMVKHAPRELEIHDLVSAGTVGLVQALEGFEPARGLAFSTYAVPRIRGAILDELRSQDRMPRTVRHRKRGIAEARSRLQQKHGRAPTDRELATLLGIDVATLWRWEQDIEGRTVVPLDEPAGPHGSELRLSETLADPTAVEPGESLDHDQALGLLRTAFDALPQRERLVLTLYYNEELTLRQIGEVLHITESRVSQIRTRALARLRGEIESAAEEEDAA
jgi:RNA polymerase sigma factor for flagellar operon FliA